MNKVINETLQASYFGVCPECGSADAIINVERTHWCVCHTHKIAWGIGDNLFTAWTTTDPTIWRANNYFLATCRLIQFSAAVYDRWTPRHRELCEEGHLSFDRRFKQRGFQQRFKTTQKN